jgi:lysophospholipase L1-like esterase
MKYTFANKPLALLALAGITACSGGAAGTGGALPSSIAPAQTTSNASRVHPDRGGLLAKIVGVGDSLTAGYQAGGFLGQANVKDPIDPSAIVPPTQENGWWTIVDEQASGLPIPAAIAREYDPATSPLPLIAGPGLNNQLVPALPPNPFGMEKPGDSCKDENGFDAAGFLLNQLGRVRLNPQSKLIRNVAVPGITLHEANVLFEPQTTTCEPIPGVPGLLSLIVNGESSVFWPVLGNFANMGPNLSETNAAASLHPTIATVWLGANDVLKYMGTGGRFTGGDDTVGQVSSDLNFAIRKLYVSGAHVVVANLPDVLLTPYFQRVTIPSQAQCNAHISTYAACVMSLLLGGLPNSSALVSEAATKYHLATPGGCTPGSTTNACGYITVQGTFAILAYAAANKGKLIDLDAGVPGSGLGTNYITPQFADKIQQLNDTVNAGIEQSVHQNNVPMVDVRSIFQGIASGDKSNPYFAQAIAIAPGKPCCTLAYGHGLVSYDGLHPSNTGYGLLAYYFIKTINTSFHIHIKQVELSKFVYGTRCSNKSYCYPDPYYSIFFG